MVRINGQALDIAGISLNEYLSQTNYDIKRIAVECNGEIIAKSKYDAMILREGDCIEVVSFVGGG